MEFKQTVIEALQYYVYCLVDPRDNKIFYVGKGYGNRVFNHAADSLNENLDSLKLNTIRDICKEGLKVGYYIIRHGLSENEAYIVESALIDVLTYEKFNTESILTNIQAGHHQWDKGVKTVDEINAMYDCQDLILHTGDRIMCININKTYKPGIDYYGVRENIYEATRKYWRLNENRARNATVVLSVYHGIVRAAFKPIEWRKSDVKFETGARWEFTGVEIPDSPYLNKSIKYNIKKGNQNPIFYINM